VTYQWTEVNEHGGGNYLIDAVLILNQGHPQVDSCIPWLPCTMDLLHDLSLLHAIPLAGVRLILIDEGSKYIYR